MNWAILGFSAKSINNKVHCSFFLPPARPSFPTLIYFLAAPGQVRLVGIFSQFEFQRKLPYYLVVVVKDWAHLRCCNIFVEIFKSI